MHPFTVSFDDATSGEANCKTPQPAYRVGEVAGYDVTGQTPRGMNKIKVTRNPDPSKGRFTGQPEAENMPGDPIRVSRPPARSVAQKQVPVAPVKWDGAPDLPVNLPHGATVGGALARAVEFYIEGCKSTNTSFSWGEQAKQSIDLITRELVEIQGRIERGESPANEPF